MDSAFRRLLSRQIERRELDVDRIASEAGFARSRLNGILDGKLDYVGLSHDELKALAAAAAWNQEDLDRALAAPLVIAFALSEPVREFLKRQAAAPSALFALQELQGPATPITNLRGTAIYVSDRQYGEDRRRLEAYGIVVHTIVPDDALEPPRKFRIDKGPALFAEVPFDVAPKTDDQGWPLLPNERLERQRASSEQVAVQCVRYGNALFRPESLVATSGYYERHPRRVADAAEIGAALIAQHCGNPPSTTMLWLHRQTIFVLVGSGVAMQETLENMRGDKNARMAHETFSAASESALRGWNPLHSETQQWSDVASRCHEELGADIGEVNEDVLQRCRQRRLEGLMQRASQRKAERPSFARSSALDLVKELLTRESVLPSSTLHLLRQCLASPVVSLGVAALESDDFVGAWSFALSGRWSCEAFAWKCARTSPRPFELRGGFIDGGDILVSLARVDLFPPRGR